ncbi:glycosyltransferase family 4 protein [Nitrospira moscoviensis]|uniref:Putative Phosphatidylinositol alpha-mannosyltransferase n=1 Tax=Nitrospira moscoviensis TaxID=42253 RepID=A0A0K2GJW3_NITMO|nr:glycosyltransferase family 4 protein [Nitrospira moscoviensis]ALA61144.1 putative Phosphatidylinositol alpha-mannosyltransferase [Nitrospira moscoviensis]
MIGMSALPKILVIGPTPPPFHGVSVATEAVLKSALRERFRLEHLDLSDRRGIQHVDKPDLHDVVLFLKQWWRLIAMLREERPAVTYLPLSQSTIGFLRDSFLILPAWLSGSQVVLHLHGGNFRTWYDSRWFLMKASVRMVLRRVSYVAVLGESLRHVFDGLMAPYRIAVVPNGISWPVVRKLPHEPHKPRRFRILHLSTLSRLKGALVLLSAIPIIVKVRRDVEFILAGPWSDEEDRRQAEAMIARHGLTGHVVFTGPVSTLDHKRSIYSSADLFVFPGVQQEGQPLVVLEAMASGLPVLFTDRGCLRDTVTEGECGLEVRSGDPKHLAEQILWFLDRPEEIERMGRNARQRFERFYTSERFVRHVGDLFTLASGGWRPRRDVASVGVGGTERHQVR